MSKTRYTDNTNAEDPPGGKRHDVRIEDADRVPPEQGNKAHRSNRTALSNKKAARATR